MSSKVSKKQNKKKGENLSMILAIVFGCLTIGIVIGVLVTGFMRGSENRKKSGKVATGGELVDYQKSGMIELGDYKGLSMSLDVTDEDIDYEIEFLLDEYKEVTQLDGPAKDGDQVNVDFVGKVDGKEFEDGSAEDEVIEIGAGEYVDGFEEQIVGMVAGETKDITVRFPSDYGDEELDGKEAVFTLTMNYVVGDEVETKFDDAFVQRISNGEYQTVEAYKEYMKEYLRKENEEYKADTYWEMVMENVEFSDVDEGEFNKAYNETIDMYANFADMNGDSLEDYGTEEDFEYIAYEVVYERMAAKTIAAIENIEMTEEFYRNALLYELDDDEYQDMTTSELEKEYTEMSGSDPKDDMLVVRVKEYLAETAVIS